MKALILARFQPFHLGHLHAIESAKKKFDEVVIAIGSSDKKNSMSNPFTFEERKKMVETCVSHAKVIGIEDMENDEEWVRNVLEKVEFDVVVSNSPWIKKCFSGKKEVQAPDLLVREVYNGTLIREKMVKGNDWKEFVPKKVSRFIKKIDGERRIKKLAEKDLEF